MDTRSGLCNKIYDTDHASLPDFTTKRNRYTCNSPPDYSHTVTSIVAQWLRLLVATTDEQKSMHHCLAYNRGSSMSSCCTTGLIVLQRGQ